MLILCLNYPRNKRAKINILVIENRKVIEYDQNTSLKSFLITLFHGRWVLHHFVGVKERKDLIVLHFRGYRSDIDDILGELSRFGKFSIRQRCLILYMPAYLINCPYYIRRHGPELEKAYQKALGNAVPKSVPKEIKRINEWVRKLS